MTLSGSFVAFAGSVTGRDHRRAERDGQDGHAVVDTGEVVAAIVTDGCSSGRASEIGARVGAAWLAALVARRFTRVDLGDEALATAARDVTRELLVRLEALARSFDPSGAIRTACVGEALLFGFLAAVVTPRGAVVFGVGDGIVVIGDRAGDRVLSIDPGPENAPPYLAYGLLRGREDRVAPSPRHAGEDAAPRIHFVGPAADVELLAVATDGAAPLVADARGEASNADDATNASLTLAALVRDPRLANNPSLLRKRLVVLSDRRTFSDDATIAVLRRRPA